MELETQARPQRYVLLEPIGRGGSAETWRARRAGSLVSDDVCVKRPLRHLTPQDRRAFVEEARLLSRIRHANVVALLDALEDRDGSVFLVLELVTGTDLSVLAAWLFHAGKRLRSSVVAAIGAAVCRALGAAQRALPNGVVHRDVTPHNVLISCEGEIKLADFGIARAGDRESWTERGLIKGKAAFLSPEQLRGEQLDVRSDLFSLGVILFELLAGFRPFRAGSVAQALERRRSLMPLRISALAPDLPSGLARVVESLLEERPDERPGVDTAARALGAWANEQRAVEDLSLAVTALLHQKRRARPAPHGQVMSSMDNP